MMGTKVTASSVHTLYTDTWDTHTAGGLGEKCGAKQNY